MIRYKDLHVVFATYRENLRWLADAHLPCPYTILSASGHGARAWTMGTLMSPLGMSPKKSTIFKFDKIPCVQVPNAGREAGQYLRFIIDNYDQLPKRIMFLQADVGVRFYTHMGLQRQRVTFVKGLIEATVHSPWSFGNLSFFGVHADAATVLDHPAVPFPKDHPILAKVIPSEKMPDVTIQGCWGGHHFVDREVILKHPKQYYEAFYRLRGPTDLGYDLEFVWPSVYQVSPPTHRLAEWQRRQLELAQC